MIGERILEFADLQQLSGHTRGSAVQTWLRDNGIPFKYSRRGVWTTLDALNFALGVAPIPEEGPASPDLIG